MARKKVDLLPSTEHALEKVGANIKRARLRRNIRAELLAERAGISADTLAAIETLASEGRDLKQFVDDYLSFALDLTKYLLFQNIYHMKE